GASPSLTWLISASDSGMEAPQQSRHALRAAVLGILQAEQSGTEPSGSLFAISPRPLDPLAFVPLGDQDQFSASVAALNDAISICRAVERERLHFDHQLVL